MALILKINQDELYSFFCHYDALGALEKKIWQAATWWVKRFPCAHPRQSKIAEKVGCRREHVNRCFAKFKNLGWMHLTSRGARRTKIIGIPTHLVSIDVVKREYFKRIEITSERTHSYSSYKNKYTSSHGVLEIPQYLKKKDLPRSVKLKLALVSEYIYKEAYYQCSKKIKTGWKPVDEISYFVGTALGIAKRKGMKLDWKSYYQSLKAV